MSYELNNARDLIRREEETRMKREHGGKNWPFHFQMQEFERDFWKGVNSFPNLKEIDANEFAQHPCISGSYGSKLLGSASTKFLDGMKYERYANVLFQKVQGNAGFGVAFVAVPENPEEWGKSQHYKNEVKHKLRHWTFCLCDHKFERAAYRNCVTTYSCSECDWTFEVDSSG